MTDVRETVRPAPPLSEAAAAAAAPRGLVNRAVAAMPPSGIRRFFDLVSTMTDVISLGVGEPDFVTPWHIREAAIWSIEKGYTTYTSNAGMFELRVLVSADVQAQYGVSYDPTNEILITVGVSEGLDVAMRAILEPADEVLIPEPSFVAYKPCVSLAGGVPVPVPTDAAHDFKVQPEAIEARLTPRTRALLLSYPSNPTGATMCREELLPIAALCCQHNLLAISDEIYAHLTYEGEHCCVPSLPGMRERTILINGFSKAYALTGWRMGFAAGALSSGDDQDPSYTMMSAHRAQMAAIEALKNEARARGDDPAVQPAPAVDHRRAEPDRPPLLPGAWRVLRLPLRRRHRPRLRDVRRAPAGGRAGGGGAGQRLRHRR